MDLIQDLESRNLIYQVSDRDALARRLATSPITLYIGFDPTADSLHIGNLLQILLLRRFQLAGHNPIALVGTGTGLVGDPSGKSSERRLNAMEVVEEWSAKIGDQLRRFLDFDGKTNPARLVSNYEWLGKLEIIPFLRDVGKHFPIGFMLAKDSVKSRLDSGISYTEFSYMILQSYDFLRLFQDFGCELQAGGSDQWGNITAGTELIRRVTGSTAFGLTLPLLTRADGAKLGKSADGTIWLDGSRTTPYQFYQYWLNVSDQDAIPLLKYFTFLPREDLRDLAEEVEDKPWERAAQRTLALEVTSLVHGGDSASSAANISQALFYGKVSELTAGEIDQGLNDVPSYDLRGDRQIMLVDLLADGGISPSKRRAREDIRNGAIIVNDVRLTDVNSVLTPADRIAGRFIVVRRGKNSYHLVRWIV